MNPSPGFVVSTREASGQRKRRRSASPHVASKPSSRLQTPSTNDVAPARFDRLSVVFLVTRGRCAANTEDPTLRSKAAASSKGLIDPGMFQKSVLRMRRRASRSKRLRWSTAHARFGSHFITRGSSRPRCPRQQPDGFLDRRMIDRRRVRSSSPRAIQKGSSQAKPSSGGKCGACSGGNDGPGGRSG
jgi:hypothetical protein